LRRAADERPLDDLIAEAIERPLSRRTLLSRGRDLGLTLAASSFLTACGTAASAGERPKPPPHHDSLAGTPKYLVMLIIDAGRPDYLSYTDLPNIKGLMQRGTYFDRAWVGQLEAITPASHATIGSGCFPSSDGGILGFWWEDPDSKSTFNSVPLDGSDPDSLSVILANSGAPTMSEYIKRHDSRAKIYTASGQKFYAADAVGGVYADYVSYFKSTNGKWGPVSMPGRELPSSIINDPRFVHPDGLPLGHQDALVGDLAMDVIRKERPRVVILNLPEMDWPVAHIDGGPLSPGPVKTLMKNADRILGKLINEYDGAGILHETVFMLLGDHGVTPLENFVNPQGLQGAMQAVANVVTFDTHTGAFAWLDDATMSSQAAAAVENSGAPGVAAVYYLKEVGGRRTYVPAPNTSKATHNALGAAFQYLLHTTAGDNAPHVVCFYPERTGTMGAGGKVKWLGDHGGSSWSSQGIPLIMAGPGVKQGHVSHFPARLVDLAPTAMRLLGAPYPRTDGLVLADALQNPTSGDVNQQRHAAQYLVPMVKALRKQAALDVQGQPPMTPAKPSKTSPKTITVGPGY